MPKSAPNREKALSSLPAVTASDLKNKFGAARQHAMDAMVARMNTPAAKQGVAKLFQALPAALGKSAVEAARSRGR